MIEYARISATDHEGIKIGADILVQSETDRFISGYIVNREGAHKGVLWVIDKAAVTSRNPLVMNPTYGMLELDSEAERD